MKEKRRGEHRKVGRDEAQERRGNGADVEKSDERSKLPPDSQDARRGRHADRFG